MANRVNNKPRTIEEILPTLPTDRFCLARLFNGVVTWQICNVHKHRVKEIISSHLGFWEAVLLGSLLDNEVREGRQCLPLTPSSVGEPEQTMLTEARIKGLVNFNLKGCDSKARCTDLLDRW